MQYKTIILEMLQQRTELHEQLRRNRQLLPALETYAQELQTSHEAWKETLSQARPGSDSIQIASEAMEMAIQELEERLPPVSPPNETEPLSLDGAMNYIRRHTSRD